MINDLGTVVGCGGRDHSGLLFGWDFSAPPTHPRLGVLQSRFNPLVFTGANRQIEEFRMNK